MERKIGEIFEYDGEWYQCVEQKDSDEHKCAFYKLCISSRTIVMDGCHRAYRTDCKDVVFRKLKKVGKPVDFNLRKCQRYKVAFTPYTLPAGKNVPCMFYNVLDNLLYIEVKQNKEDMEEKTNVNVKPTPLEKLVIDFFNNRVTDMEFERRVSELYAEHSNSEKIGKNLKEFNLEAAKSGKPVCTRDGRKARIICFDYKGDANAYPILALISTINERGVPSEIIAKYTEYGKYAKYNNVENDEDLMMLSEKKEGWEE